MRLSSSTTRKADRGWATRELTGACYCTRVAGWPANPSDGEGKVSRALVLLSVSGLGVAALALVFLHPPDRGPTRTLAALGIVSLVAVTVALALAQDRWRRRETRLAAEAASNAARARSELLANVGHELRTPLGAVLGMTELALGTALTAEQREYVEKAHGAARQLGGLVEDLLDLARIEEGPLRLDDVAFSLPVLVAETLRAFSPTARGRGIELLCDIETGVPDGVRGDPARLRQVLAQLLDNALKFTERGRVAVRVRRAPDDAERLEITVSDTGIGIAARDLARIFEPFTQVDGSRSRRRGGTGLGLGLSVRLAGLMGGRVWAESEPGRGSAFHLEVRLLADPAGDAASERDISDLAGRPVLVLDGQEASRQALGELLQSLGLPPTLTGDAAQALDALNRAVREGAPFAAVIVDRRVRGSVAFRAQRSEDDPLLAATPHIVLESAGEAIAAFRGGLSPGLTRPVTRPELLTALRRAVLAPPPRAMPVPTPARPLRVLVAEDNPVNAFMAVRMIESLGHRGEVVGTGRQAVDALVEDGFDVVLMDLQMPEMDGEEATRLIRAAERGSDRHVRILAVTAQTRPQDLEQCLDAGMDGFLAKPFSLRALREALEGEGQTDTPSPAAPLPPAASIDRERLQAQLGDDAEGVEELLGTFARDAPGHMATLRAAVSSGDAQGIERAAHRIKGSLLWLRAERAGARAAALEQIGQSGELVHASRVLAELDLEVEQVVAEARGGKPAPRMFVAGIETPAGDSSKP